MIPNIAKLTIARTMFLGGRGISVYFDGRAHLDGRACAVIPDASRGQLTALRFTPGTPGERVEFDEVEISATLLFGGDDGQSDPELRECLVPWRTVFAVRDDISFSTVVWPTELPDDVSEITIQGERGSAPVDSCARPSHLTLVP